MGKIKDIPITKFSFLLSLVYEKVRTMMEFKELHLLSRLAIERVLSRYKVVGMGSTGNLTGERLAKELLRAGYYSHINITQESIEQIDEIIKNSQLKNKESIALTACAIDETLDPAFHKKQILLRDLFSYNIMQRLPDQKENDELLIKIAVEKIFLKSDKTLIKYRLQKGIPNSRRFQQITKKIRQEAPAFIVLKELLSNQDKTFFNDSNNLKRSVFSTCARLYAIEKATIVKKIFRSIVYLFLTKMLFALALELPFDLYIIKNINYFPILINTVFPPTLMLFIGLRIKTPTLTNSATIYERLNSMIFTPGDSLPVIIKPDKQSKLSGLLHFLYTLAFGSSFGLIIFVLNKIGFNIASIIIFLFFLSLVSFFGFLLRRDAQELDMDPDSETAASPFLDFLAVPIIKVGQKLSEEVARINITVYILDFLIEAPLKGFLEIVDQWAVFAKEKKEEII